MVSSRAPIMGVFFFVKLLSVATSVAPQYIEGWRMLTDQKAELSTTHSPNAKASNAIDGNTDGSFWKKSCVHTAKSNNNWFSVTLPSHAVTDVRIYNRRDCCGNRLTGTQLLMSTNDKKEISCGKVDQWAGVVDIKLNPECRSRSGPGRKLKLFKANGILNFCEVVVKTSAPVKHIGIWRMLVDQTAQLSSTYNSWGKASHAIDGNTNSRWSGKSCAHTSAWTTKSANWFSVTLPDEAVTHVRIYNRRDCCGNRLNGTRLMMSTRDNKQVDCGEVIRPYAVVDIKLNSNCSSQHGPGRKLRLYKKTGILNFCEIVVRTSIPHIDAWRTLVDQTAQLSSTHSTLGEASHAIDGNTNGRFLKNSCAHTAKPGHNWFSVTLPDDAVTHARIYNRVDCCGNQLNGTRLIMILKNANEVHCGKLNYITPSPNFVDIKLNPACSSLFGPGRKLKLYKEEGFLIFCEIVVKTAVPIKYIGDWRTLVDQTAQLSSTYDFRSEASNAIDGNTNSRYSEYSCVHTRSGSPLGNWFKVTLPNEAITDVRIYNRGDCCGNRLKRTRLIMSTKGRDIECGEVTQSSKVVDIKLNTDCSSQSGPGRTLKLHKADGHLNFCEIVVKTTAPIKRIGEWRTLVDQTAQLSSTYSTRGEASHAIDGNTNSRFGQNSCVHTGKPNNNWFSVTLPDEAVVQVRIYNRVDCCSNRLKGTRLSMLTHDDTEVECGIIDQTSAVVDIDLKKECASLSGPGRKLKLFKPTGALHFCEITVKHNRRGAKCLQSCGNKSGQCDWCGTKPNLFCCRDGVNDPGCAGAGGKDAYRCVLTQDSYFQHQIATCQNQYCELTWKKMALGFKKIQLEKKVDEQNPELVNLNQAFQDAVFNFTYFSSIGPEKYTHTVKLQQQCRLPDRKKRAAVVDKFRHIRSAYPGKLPSDAADLCGNWAENIEREHNKGKTLCDIMKEANKEELKAMAKSQGLRETEGGVQAVVAAGRIVTAGMYYSASAMSAAAGTAGTMVGDMGAAQSFADSVGYAADAVGAGLDALEAGTNSYIAFEEAAVLEMQQHASKLMHQADEYDECKRPNTAALSCQIDQIDIQLKILPSMDAKLDNLRVITAIIQKHIVHIKEDIDDVLANQEYMKAILNRIQQIISNLSVKFESIQDIKQLVQWLSWQEQLPAQFLIQSIPLNTHGCRKINEYNDDVMNIFSWLAYDASHVDSVANVAQPLDLDRPDLKGNYFSSRDVETWLADYAVMYSFLTRIINTASIFLDKVRGSDLSTNEIWYQVNDRFYQSQKYIKDKVSLRKCKSCTNGAKKYAFCTEEENNNGQICESCKFGFSLTKTGYGKHGAECLKRECKCNHGEPTNLCSDNFSCKRCDSGYHLEKEQLDVDSLLCRPNQCRCDNGQATRDDQCDADNSESCQKCNEGYRKIFLNRRMPTWKELDFVKLAISAGHHGELLYPRHMMQDTGRKKYLQWPTRVGETIIKNPGIIFSVNALTTHQCYDVDSTVKICILPGAQKHYDLKVQSKLTGGNDHCKKWPLAESIFICANTAVPLETKSEHGRCKKNVCKCANGFVSTKKPCMNDGGQNCGSCNRGYHVEGDSLNQPCLMNKCWCLHGRPITDTRCIQHLETVGCESCNDGYSGTSHDQSHGRENCFTNRKNAHQVLELLKWRGWDFDELSDEHCGKDRGREKTLENETVELYEERGQWETIGEIHSCFKSGGDCFCKKAAYAYKNPNGDWWKPGGQ